MGQYCNYKVTVGFIDGGNRSIGVSDKTRKLSQVSEQLHQILSPKVLSSKPCHWLKSNSQLYWCHQLLVRYRSRPRRSILVEYVSI